MTAQAVVDPGEPRLSVSGLHKSFPGVHALDDVSLEILPGEVHAIVGENGAGKSTLIKILSGVYTPDAGSVAVDGHQVAVANPHVATQLGITAVHQDSQLVPYLSVAENVFLGHQPGGVRVDFRERDHRARQVLNELDASLDVLAPVEGLSAAQAQMVAIARAMSVQARTFIFDEPTASLSPREADALFRVIHRLRQRGISIIYISHRLEEVFAFADRLTVLRDGRRIATRSITETTIDDVVSMMIGRSPQELFVRGERPEPGAPVLSVRDLSVGQAVRNVSLEVRAGELVGLFGLVGSGRTELVRAIFGADPVTAGQVWVGDRLLSRANPRSSMKAGLGLAPEDRKRDGLILDMAVRDNIALGRISLANEVLYRPTSMRRFAQDLVQRLGIKVADVDGPVRVLSGGNQQRVVIAKWLSLKPRVLILDEPTQGIDVGAKAEIYRILSDLLSDGIAVLMVSSDLQEIVQIADRILIMRRGEIVGEFSHTDATEDSVGRTALGAERTNVDGGLANAG